MKIEHITTSILIVLMFLSCKNEVAESQLSQNNKDVALVSDEVPQRKLEHTGELKIPIDTETTFYSESIQYVENSDIGMLLILPKSSNTINVYKVGSIDIIQTDKILLKKEGPDDVGGEVSGFNFINPDSIFVFSKFTHKISLVDSKGKVKNKYQVLNEYDPKKSVPMVGTFSPLVFRNNKFFLAGDVPVMRDSGKYNKLFFEYNIENKETSFLIDNPKKIELGNWERLARLYYDYIPSSDEFVLGFNVSDELITYKNGISTRHKVRSDLINADEIRPFGPVGKKAKDYVDRAKYSIGTPKFWGIKYDKFKELYYRFGVIKSDFSDFQKGIIADKVICVYNKNFEKISETRMHSTRYDYDMSFISENGLHLANKEKYNEDDNFITFDIYKLK